MSVDTVFIVGLASAIGALASLAALASIGLMIAPVALTLGIVAIVGWAQTDRPRPRLANIGAILALPAPILMLGWAVLAFARA